MLPGLITGYTTEVARMNTKQYDLVAAGRINRCFLLRIPIAENASSGRDVHEQETVILFSDKMVTRLIVKMACADRVQIDLRGDGARHEQEIFGIRPHQGFF